MRSFKLLFALVLGFALAVPLAHALCTTPSGKAGDVFFNTTHKVMQYCNGNNWVNTGASVPAAGSGGCNTPAASAGAVFYNSPTGVVQFCNGENWVDTACATARNPEGSGCSTPTAAAGTLFYETTRNELQFCDSTNWVAMGWPCGASNTPVTCSTMGGTNIDPYTCRFDTEGVYDLTLAANRSMFVQAWGGGGGAGSTSNGFADSDGGAGGYSEGTVLATGSTRQYKVVVGSGGGAYSTNATTCPGTRGNIGGPGAGSNSIAAGNGGGYSGIFLTSISHGNSVLLAGGGGGGGTNASTYKGGVGGGLTGGNGQDNSATGGTQSAGGTSSYGNGSALQGGISSNYVGGGGGYYGGAGSNWGGGGGGGGSAFLSPSLHNASTQSGSGRVSGGSTHANYYGDAGQGGIGSNTDGQATSCGKQGLVVVNFNGGSGGGGGTFAIATAPSGNGTTAITHPAPGHTGQVTVYLAGTSSAVGSWWNNDSKGGTQGSGQTAVYTFTTTGSETSFSLTQTNSGSSSGQLALVINGGANSGRKLVVGSAGPANGYGAAAAANNYTTGYSDVPGAVLVRHGASRPHDATISYTDGTNYSPATPASYGSAATVYYLEPYTITMRNATSPGGMKVDNTEYGSAVASSPPIAGAIRLGGVVMQFH